MQADVISSKAKAIIAQKALVKCKKGGAAAKCTGQKKAFNRATKAVTAAQVKYNDGIIGNSTQFPNDPAESQTDSKDGNSGSLTGILVAGVIMVLLVAVAIGVWFKTQLSASERQNGDPNSFHNPMVRTPASQSLKQTMMHCSKNFACMFLNACRLHLEDATDAKSARLPCLCRVWKPWRLSHRDYEWSTPYCIEYDRQW